MTQITVLGASGFIGSHLVKRLRELNLDYFAPARDDHQVKEHHLGIVIYCVGLTADFRTRPFDTVDAHVCKLREVLSTYHFDSLVYLSSARVYRNNSHTNEEVDVSVNSSRADDLYNLSKLTGESLALDSSKPVRVVRLSNVYGIDLHSDNFISAVLREAIQEGKVTLYSSLDSAKDYVSVDDVVNILLRIASSGAERLYNVASGRNVTNLELMNRIQELIPCNVKVVQGAPRSFFPPIDIDRVRHEFGFAPRNILDDLKPLIELYKTALTVASNSQSQYSALVRE